MRQELYVLPDRRQMKERRHRSFELVPHAADFDSELGWSLRADASAK
jgi:hypothetical protein